jgi:hypothetical protein
MLLECCDIQETKKIGATRIPKGMTYEEFLKTVIDKVVAKTPEQRRKWYDLRVKIMHDPSKKDHNIDVEADK